MKHFIAALALTLIPAACATATPPPVETVALADESSAIASVLFAQQQSWNSGDINGFMQGYVQSPELRFASGGSVTTGWQATSDRYRARYSDRVKMGALTFSDLEIDQVSADAAVVHGRWLLTRDADAPNGLFTLIFRKIDGEWLIVSDTTTSAGS